MNLDLELESIIAKYNLQIDINKILHDDIHAFLQENCVKKRVALMCGGEYAQHLLQDYGNLLRPTRVMDNDIKKWGEQIGGVPICPVENYDDTDVIIVCTSEYRDAVKAQLRSCGITADGILDIQEYIEKNGLHGSCAYFAVEDNVYVPFVFLNNRYEKTCGEVKEAYLIKLISAYLAIRDIVSAKRYIDIYLERYGNKYRDLMNEIDDLLLRIRNSLSRRNQRDIIWSWEDALHYEWLKWMPFHSSIRETGLLFTNAYASSVTTRLVYEQIFNKRYEIDDKSYIEIEKNDYPLVKLLRDNGYDCIRINNLNAGERIQKLETFRFARDKVVGFQIATSQQYWNALNYIVNSSKPVFVLIHSAIEVHQPMCSPWLYEYNVEWSNFKQRFEDEFKERLYKNIQINCEYLDAQAEFLNGFLGTQAVRLFMSDHGSSMEKKSRRWNKDACQMVFGLFGGGIPARNCNQLFCLYNFEEAVRYALNPSEKNFQNIFLDEIKLQSLDYYNKDTIEWFINNGEADNGISFRGVMTLKDRYVLKRTGEEIYNVFPDDYTNHIEDIEYKERVDELRKRTGNNFINFDSDEKFKYTQLLYDFLSKKSEKSKEKRYEHITTSQENMRGG